MQVYLKHISGGNKFITHTLNFILNHQIPCFTDEHELNTFKKDISLFVHWPVGFSICKHV